MLKTLINIFGTNKSKSIKFLATLQFDGTDWLDSGEQNFPQAFKFQSYDENIEHNKENLIRFKIGESIFGTSSTGWENRGSNDQRPAVYFHSVTKVNMKYMSIGYIMQTMIGLMIMNMIGKSILCI